ncbi:hypothetical protein J437_LFUL016164 [Ladona fulva]|uniref:Uncharacterized protein n=1 Tax=Ladona fulva TaxID=123851 RepID=A0A8K0KI92_LADFU|nr:hypothetical protein J437_LFUL016164 [Ladona fulva]
MYKLMVGTKLDKDKDYLKNELVRTISKLYDVPDTSGVLVDALTKRYFNESELGDFKTMYTGLIDVSIIYLLP